MSDCLENKKKELLTWIASVEDEHIIDQLNMVREESAIYSRSETEVTHYADLPEAAKNSIKRGLADLTAGRSKPREEVRKLYEKYL